MEKVFLAATWKNLIMANYVVDPGILKRYIPPGTELDIYADKVFVSLVGFMFLDTRVLGVAVPFHRNFEEVNLRFYVRYKAQNEWRRGVVFIKEIVPRRAIAFVANTLYSERYQCLPMKNELSDEGGLQRVGYWWKFNNEWNYLKVVAETKAAEITEGSEAEFITEHYWGYASGKGVSAMEYQVEHTRWSTFRVLDFELRCDVAGLYGADFKQFLNAKPHSVFMADGSEVLVRKGKRIIL